MEYQIRMKRTFKPTNVARSYAWLEPIHLWHCMYSCLRCSCVPTLNLFPSSDIIKTGEVPFSSETHYSVGEFSAQSHPYDWLSYSVKSHPQIFLSCMDSSYSPSWSDDQSYYQPSELTTSFHQQDSSSSHYSRLFQSRNPKGCVSSKISSQVLISLSDLISITCICLDHIAVDRGVV